MSPLRAARSSSVTAVSFSAALASSEWAFFSAVRSVERWARLRAIAARDLRMFFFAEAIFGTNDLQELFDFGKFERYRGRHRFQRMNCHGPDEVIGKRKIPDDR